MKNPKISAPQKMILVTDETGSIISVSKVMTASGDRPLVGMVPLPGQKVQEVEIPKDLAEIESGDSFFRAIAGARVEPSTGKLILEHSIKRITKP